MLSVVFAIIFTIPGGFELKIDDTKIDYKTELFEETKDTSVKTYVNLYSADQHVNYKDRDHSKTIAILAVVHSDLIRVQIKLATMNQFDAFDEFQISQLVRSSADKTDHHPVFFAV